MNLRESFDLSGKVALVTGASRGLGRGFALALSSAGAFTVLLARNSDRLSAAVSEIEKSGGKADSVAVDINDLAKVKKEVDRIVQRHDKIDILVNNAGFEIPKSFLEVTESDFDAIVGTNLKALYFITQNVARHMITQGSGKVVNIGSLASHIGIAKATVYSASKGGVLQLTKALALELAPYNIQVNAIGPGYFHTDMTDPFIKDTAHRKWIEDRIPAGRIGKEEDLAAAAVFLSSSGSDYITGQIFYVDGGWLAG
jgi:NAD(P)-dependent dehydrogenase (short-subunit alcohol dehydrogenase family)